MPNFTNLVARPPLLAQDRLRMRVVPEALRDVLVDGLFEGGGALGAAYLGGLRALHDNRIWFARVAGNSAGAITAALIAAGFTAKELQWLSSRFDVTAPPASLAARGIVAPLDFMSFLDLPSRATVSDRSMRKTQLWQALNGSILDEIGQTKLPFPTQKEAVDACIREIKKIPVVGPAAVSVGDGALRAGLNLALILMPNQPLRIRDFLPDTAGLRREFADTVWKALASVSPGMVAMTNLVHEGGLFEGRVFERTVATLLSRKVHGQSNKAVRFADLPLPLVVVAANIDTGEMELYGSAATPDMEVAEAVRRSMSIPFFFEPRGNRRQIVDGGVLANFPLFLFAGGNEKYWPAGSGAADRTTVGFTLDEARRPPSQWNPGPGRFALTGNPARVDTGEVVRPILVEKLAEVGVPGVDIALDVADTLDGPKRSDGTRPFVEILQQALGVTTRGVLAAEEITRSAVVAGLMAGRPYVDVAVPLLGFHTLDFAVDGDEVAVREMWDRAWRATVAAATVARTKNGALPTRPLTITASPFG